MPGTGKTTVAARFLPKPLASAGSVVCILLFEESQDQIARNMRSVGIDLGKWIKKGLLTFHASRPSLFGLEMHLVNPCTNSWKESDRR